MTHKSIMELSKLSTKELILAVNLMTVERAAQIINEVILILRSRGETVPEEFFKIKKIRNNA